jgi:hypothetical protein
MYAAEILKINLTEGKMYSNGFKLLLLLKICIKHYAENICRKFVNKENFFFLVLSWSTEDFCVYSLRFFFFLFYSGLCFFLIAPGIKSVFFKFALKPLTVGIGPFHRLMLQHTFPGSASKTIVFLLCGLLLPIDFL